jgi:hypothetical protein
VPQSQGFFAGFFHVFSMVFAAPKSLWLCILTNPKGYDNASGRVGVEEAAAPLF